MVYIINSNDFLTQAPSNNPGGAKVLLSGFPTLYLESGEYLEPVNLWINHLVNERRSKNINSNLRAITRYWRFLESNHMSWDTFPPSKYKKPTYLFRNNDLLASVKAGTLQLSTASLYLNHVVQFYRWAMREKLLITDEKNSPFQSELLKISSYGRLAHMANSYNIRTTDLRIRIPKKSPNQSLNPLTKEELAIYSKQLNQCCVEFKLHQLLQTLCGLRVREACTFPASLVHKPTELTSKVEVEIGPHVGVETKFGAKRKVEISSFLMDQLYQYLISERRYLRSIKYDFNSGALLICVFR